jgi:hypothetical protein
MLATGIDNTIIVWRFSLLREGRWGARPVGAWNVEQDDSARPADERVGPIIGSTKGIAVPAGPRWREGGREG